RVSEPIAERLQARECKYWPAVLLADLASQDLREVDRQRIAVPGVALAIQERRPAAPRIPIDQQIGKLVDGLAIDALERQIENEVVETMAVVADDDGQGLEIGECCFGLVAGLVNDEPCDFSGIYVLELNQDVVRIRFGIADR